MVVADHQRRAPRHAGRLRAGRPVRFRRSSTSRVRAHWPDCSASLSPRWTWLSAASSTRPCLDERGGFKSDLTVMRLGPQHFRVVTGGATGMTRQEVDSPTICPRTAPLSCRPHLCLDDLRPVGPAGPGGDGGVHRRRRLQRRLSLRDLPAGRARRHKGAGVAHLLCR